ncbi:MAG: hypothetical protein C4297_10805 [Gemmataceae bacterium]
MPPSLLCTRRTFVAAGLTLLGLGRLQADEPHALPGTEPLTESGDLARLLVDGLHRYLDRRTRQVAADRRHRWRLDFSSAQAYARSVEPMRQRLRQVLGMAAQPIDQVHVRTEVVLGPLERTPILAESARIRAYAIRWDALPGVDGKGILLEPRESARAQVVYLPDADCHPLQACGLTAGPEPPARLPLRLAEAGCRVIVPLLVDRSDRWSGNARLGRATNQPHREFLYRMAYELGCHLLGWELQMVAALVQWMKSQPTGQQGPVAVMGYGEGAVLALYAGAIDPQIDLTVVHGYFGPREGLWREPIYRNVWERLVLCGDGELIYLVVPRALLIQHLGGPQITHPPERPGRGGAAPAQFVDATADESHKEFLRIVRQLPPADRFPRRPLEWFDGKDLRFYETLSALLGIGPLGGEPARLERKVTQRVEAVSATEVRSLDLQRHFDELVAYGQKVMRDSEMERHNFFWSKLDYGNVERYEQSVEPLREFFWREVIGALPSAELPPRPRTRLIHTGDWYAYEVVLDVYADVVATGILCVPKGLKAGERRPTVVCQHGLEGRPSDVVHPEKRTPYYNSFGAQLARLGLVVFAPQNPYIFGTHFRQLQRKANPLKLSLFSFIVRQHERILDWLVSLPFVDPERIAFYGLSYGGKTAMRVPAILKRYCLSICSGDFNEWVWKNAAYDFAGSYLYSGEYEMPEFNLARTFNYAEMAALICPRPFMVERGHNDGVGLDEWVAYEYAKVRRLYARLGIAERTAIEFFAGGHEIHGRGTFDFLGRHLRWQPLRGQAGGAKGP